MKILSFPLQGLFRIFLFKGSEDFSFSSLRVTLKPKICIYASLFLRFEEHIFLKQKNFRPSWEGFLEISSFWAIVNRRMSTIFWHIRNLFVDEVVITLTVHTITNHRIKENYYALNRSDRVNYFMHLEPSIVLLKV